MDRIENESLGNKMLRKRKYTRLSQKELAEILGVDPKTIYRWESGASIPKSKENRIMEFLTADDIAPDLSDGIPTITEQVDTRPRITTEVAAGALMDFADAVHEYECERLPVIKQFPNYDYTIIVRGNSMSPKYEGGDELAIKRVNSFIEWGEVYVLNTRDGAVLKRVYDAGDCFRCVSYNKEYEDFLVSKEDVFSAYRVVGMIRV